MTKIAENNLNNFQQTNMPRISELIKRKVQAFKLRYTTQNGLL